MTRGCLILSFVLCFSGSLSESKSLADDLEKFNQFLGLQKAEALDLAVDSFDKFLKKNYKTVHDYNDRVVSFIQDLYANDFKPLNHWQLDADTGREIVKKFEDSELRKDIWRYGYESYEIDSSVIEVYEHVTDSIANDYFLNHPNLEDLDLEEEVIPIAIQSPILPDSIIEQKRIEDSIDIANSIHGAEFSQFIVGLYKYQKNNTVIQDIAVGNMITGEVSPHLKADAYLKMGDVLDYNNPFIKRIIVIDFYYRFVL